MAHALARLIEHCRQQDEITYAQITRRSGGVFSDTMLSRWADGDRPLQKLPDPKNIVALAQGLRRPVLQVLIAAAQSAGMDVTESEATEFARRLPPHIDQLPDELTEELHRHIWTLCGLWKNHPAATPAR